MCGGDIQATEGATYGTCDFCGSKSTLPKASDERKANLLNRANHLRRQNEFDRAIQVYENLLMEDSTDAEAHWGIVLSRYGIVYVEDPAAQLRIPTCHRMHRESILHDADYMAALQYAPDEYARSLYEEQAQAINKVQKGILNILSTEKPYDVFICYKETTDGGSRTKDSVKAQELYHLLEKENYKTFFSRITLESKLGQQYEPYIFSALNSAKVMLVIGTKPEYFNSTWVKNEWSRYLALTKNDSSKILIPCYSDMDAYDLPEEMLGLQAQDISKIGFAQDLLHGIKKVIGDKKGGAVKSTAIKSDIEPLTKRGYMSLQESNWKKAFESFDKALDKDPEYAPAYIGKLCVELKLNSEDDLSTYPQEIEGMANFKKAMQFADDDYKECLKKYVESNKNAIEQERLKSLNGGAKKSRGQYFQKLQERYEAEKIEREEREIKIELQKTEERKIENELQAEEWEKAQKQIEQDRLERERKEAEIPEIESRKKTSAIIWAVIVAAVATAVYFVFIGGGLQ